MLSKYPANSIQMVWISISYEISWNLIWPRETFPIAMRTQFELLGSRKVEMLKLEREREKGKVEQLWKFASGCRLDKQKSFVGNKCNGEILLWTRTQFETGPQERTKNSVLSAMSTLSLVNSQLDDLCHSQQSSWLYGANVQPVWLQNSLWKGVEATRYDEAPKSQLDTRPPDALRKETE